MMIKTIALVSSVSITLSAFAIDRSVNLTFQLQPGSITHLSGQIGSGTPGTDSGAITGTIDALLVFDDETLQAKEVTLTGGRTYLEDLDLNFSGIAVGPFGASLPISVNAQSRNISQTYSTPTPPVSVTESGTIDLSQHQYILDQGTQAYVATIAVIGNQTDSVDYATTPDTNSPSGTATIAITEIATTALERTLQFTLTTNTSESESELIEGTTTTITLSGSESTESKATTTIPSAYAQWATDNDIHLISGDETNPSQLSYSLLYALGLPPETSTWPITITETTGGAAKVELTLPAGGLKLALDAEYSEALNPASWDTLPSQHYLNGVTSLDADQTGNPEFTFPNATTGFIRFKIRP